MTSNERNDKAARANRLSWLLFIVTITRPALSSVVPVDLSNRLTSYIPDLFNRK